MVDTIDMQLTLEVDLIVTALPAMRGPADESVLRQLLDAAKNLDDGTRRRRLLRSLRHCKNADKFEEPEASALETAYTNEHQPKVHTHNHTFRYQ